MKPETLLRLYPRAWRERYGEEFLAMIGNRRLSASELGDVCRAALMEWSQHTRIGGVIVAAGVAAMAEVAGRALRWSLPAPDRIVTSLSAWLAVIAVGYLLYRSNEWLFERRPTMGPRAFRLGVLFAFGGGVLEIWGRTAGPGAHAGVIDLFPIVGNSAFFWTWLLCTARRDALTTRA